MVAILSSVRVERKDGHVGQRLVIGGLVRRVRELLDPAGGTVGSSIVMYSGFRVPIFFGPRYRFVVVVSRFVNAVRKEERRAVGAFPKDAKRFHFLAPCFSIIRQRNCQQKDRGLPSIADGVMDRLVTCNGDDLRVPTQEVRDGLLLYLYDGCAACAR